MTAHFLDFAATAKSPKVRPLIVDSFAGGGGASTGIEMALGRSPDIAINHNAAALAMHEANHPETRHLSKNIWQVDPLQEIGNREVGLAWFSPDCKHFSKAKGGKPVKRNVRDLAWTVVLWAKRARPGVIILENVEEFQDWGPLVETFPGSDKWIPCLERKGETFKKWVRDLKRCGYKLEYRQLIAANYGAPTTRKRLFLIARRDGLPIVWPEPTHGKPTDPDVITGRKLPWLTAASIIDWSLPCPSIFETSQEIKAKHGVRAVRPLAPATMARVQRGTQRYVLDSAKPFIVGCGGRMGQSRERSVERPVQTMTAKADACIVAPSVIKFQTGSTGSPMDPPMPTVTANSFIKRPGGAAPLGIIAPHLVPITHTGDVRTYSAEDPMRTVTTANGGEVALVAPTLIQSGYGEREGQEPRSLDIEAPLGTVVAGGVKHALVAAHISRQFGASVGQGVNAPAPAATEVNKSMLIAAFMAQHNNDSRRAGGVNPGQPADRPISTITASGSQQGVVAAHLSQPYGSNKTASGGDLSNPAPTITTSGERGGGHAALVAAFMVKHYGTGDGQVVDDPFGTVTTRDRFGLVTVRIEGVTYVITDIGLRMLTPRELFNAQGFPRGYIIDGISFFDPETGRTKFLSKADQISCCGNSVCPPLAAALAAANAGHLREDRMAKAA
ncbi:DNA cytosine methyltransferase [Aureimonas glaciei]|uniref:DNA (cytosine-5-)-methyltransferase n=1 Tax=Aureimonas glaciei TaxID=1776957 RepID=A0A916XXV3_9HYPH|nr:DNA cytosine methyltransferase [Aureimonas glaciei]GGD19864.1 DNA methyltransferase [Aureimonas glaciei]